MEKNSRKDSFDVVKCFAAFFVVQLHTIPATVCPLLNVIARLAVPLFFLITGYYYTSIVEKGKYGVQLKKIFLLAIASSLFYWIYYGCMALKNNVFYQWFMDTFNSVSILNWVLINDTPGIGHLWYLYAMLYSFIAIYVIDKLKIKVKWVIPILFLIGLYVGCKGWPYSWYRNWAFMGVPYILLGRIIFEYKEMLIYKLGGVKIVYFIPAATIGLLGEYKLYEIVGMDPIRDHYVFIILMSGILFILALQYPYFGKGSVVAIIGREYSVFIYILHIFILRILSFYIDFSSSLMIRFLCPIIVFVCTIVVATYIINMYKLLSKKCVTI